MLEMYFVHLCFDWRMQRSQLSHDTPSTFSILNLLRYTQDRASSSSSYQRTPIPPGNHTRMLLRFMGGPTAVAGDGDDDDDDDFGGGGIHQGLLPGQDYDAVEDISGDDDDNDDNHNDDELNDDSQALGSTNDPISNRQSSTRL
jgi:hypothetical protein